MQLSDGDTSESGFGSRTASREAPDLPPLPPGRRNAGETKGVSMEENKARLAALARLLDRPGNRACADCAHGGAAGRSTWASINCGVFLCMKCAGIHRGLGVHISQAPFCSIEGQDPGLKIWQALLLPVLVQQ